MTKLAPSPSVPLSPLSPEARPDQGLQAPGCPRRHRVVSERHGQVPRRPWLACAPAGALGRLPAPLLDLVPAPPGRPQNLTLAALVAEN